MHTDFWPWLKVECLKDGIPVKTKESYFNQDSTIIHLGKLDRGNVELRAIIRPSGRGATIRAFEGRGHGALVLKKDNGEKPGEHVFAKTVSIRRNDGINPPFTRYPENHFRIVELCGNQLRHFEVALIAQNGRFFVVKQLTRAGELFRDEEVVFPPLVGWEEFTDLLTEIAKGRALKHTSKAPMPAFPAPANGLGNFQGRVLWWNLAQQFGAIRLRNGSAARIHRSHLTRPNSRLAYAATGEIVEFEKLSLPNQTTDRSTEFRSEAYAAKVLTK
ncbi:MAG: hypothetical protein UT31_C0034G0004 [Parcubacteria group bacterium GW2011_GWF2_39_13b]|nr:MAG: hypothetical protein UT31_C0034G0004 [Parcubacteria group bacterium GW2011_GWF2_39_13b]